MASAPVSAFKIWWKLLGVTFIIIIFSIVLFDSITQSIKAKSIEPFMNEAGSRLILASKNLEVESKAIIKEGSVYAAGDSLAQNIWNTLKTLSKMLSAILVVIAWLKMLVWAFSKSPWSLNDFTHYSLAFITFYTLQVFFLVGFGAIQKTTTGFSGGPNSITGYIVTPLVCYYYFFKALPFIFSPLGSVAKKLEGVATT